jgi:hypothetical protein
MRLTVLSLCTLLSTTPAFAAGGGAIAWDRNTGRYGASFNQSTPRNAEDSAIGKCGDSGCRVIMRIKPRMCAAFAATADGKKAGAAVRKNSNQARTVALADCKKNKGVGQHWYSWNKCAVKIENCNT